MPAKRSRKCKILKASFGLVEALAPKSSKECELERNESDEIKGSQVPSHNDPVPSSKECKSASLALSKVASAYAPKPLDPPIRLFRKDDGLGGYVDIPP